MSFYHMDPEKLRTEISELSIVAQQHENRGETIYADACHEQMNNALEDLRKITGK